MKFYLLLCHFATLLWLSQKVTSCTANHTGDIWELVWNDEFTAPYIDSGKWSFDIDCWGGGNGEQQCFTSRSSNAIVTNGVLTITARPETYTGQTQGCTNNNDNSCTRTQPYTSARLKTLLTTDASKTIGTWARGKFEIRAKLPKGKGLKPGLFMLPAQDAYGPWAASGAVTLLQGRGQNPSSIESQIWYGGAWPNQRWQTTGNVNFGQDLSSDFHLFTFEWTEDHMKWFLDGQEYYSQNLSRSFYEGGGLNPYTAPGQPFDKPFFLAASLAVGGSYFAGYEDLSVSEASSWWNPSLQIDYVRVYRIVPATNSPVGTSPGAPVASSSPSRSPISNINVPNGWNLAWNDEFSGNSLNLSKWQYEVDCWGGGNGEFQCYTNSQDNLKIQNGNLIITAKPGRYTGSAAGCTNPRSWSCTQSKDFTSARIRTLYDPTGSWKYGRWESRAKLPKGDYLWPALWMLPTDNVYGQWAGSGEIDIMESRGQDPYSVEGTVHFGGSGAQHAYLGSGPRNFGFDFSADYHIFALEWDSSEMRWYVDGQQYWRQNLNQMFSQQNSPYTKNGQPFDQRFYFIINLAVGGSFFGGAGPSISQGQQWVSPSMWVDYVRVFTKA